MSLEAAVRDAEHRVAALKREIAKDELAIAREHARVARCEDHIEQWWFGRARWLRLAVAARMLIWK